MQMRQGRDAERGSIVVPAAFAIVVGILLLGSAQIGWQFFMKREMQNTVDLAALSAVQVMSDQPSAALCAKAQAAGRDGAKKQMPAFSVALEDKDIQIECVRWDPATVATSGDGVVPGVPVTSANAVRVKVDKSYDSIIPGFIPGGGKTPVAASAIATLSPESATFSVGAQLIGTNPNAPLMSLLSFVGLPTNLSVLDYKGVANVNITPAGLLKELVPGIDLNAITPTQLAAINATSSRLLEASINVLKKGDPNLLTADVQALADALRANAKLGNLTIPLFSSDTSPGLFGLVTTAGRDAALFAEVNALGFIKATIESANAAYGLAIKQLDLGLINVQAGIVEPPSIGVGGVGATAYNAQIRVFIDLDTDRLKLVAPILNLLGARIRLPLTLDLVRAKGTITDIDCYSTPRTVDILVHSSTLQACFADPGAANRFSRGQACGDELKGGRPPTTVTISLLGINLLPQRLRPLELLGWDRTVRFTVPQGTQFPLIDADDGNPGRLGDMLSQWLLTLSDGLGNPSLLANSSSDQTAQYTSLAGKYLDATQKDGKYDLTAAINLMKNGSTALGYEPIGDWTIPKGVPRACGLGLGTCWDDGSVWKGFESSVTGKGLGLLDSVLGAVLGNLLVKNCASILGALDLKTCTRNNLASYLRTNPADVDHNNQYYCGPLCTLLKPVLTLLAPTLNGLGDLVVKQILGNLLGLRIGQTETRLLDLQCSRARLVY